MHQTQWSAERPLPPPVSLTSQSHHEKPPEVTCTSRGTPGFYCAYLDMKSSLSISNFLEEISSLPILLFSSISLH